MTTIGWFPVGGKGVRIADWLIKLFKFLDDETFLDDKKGLSYEGRYQVLMGMRTRNGVWEVPLTFCTKEEREVAERTWLVYRYLDFV